MGVDNGGLNHYIMGVKTERAFLVPDLHCGDEDKRAVALAIQLCDAYKPDTIYFLGDILDSGWASTYPQNQAEIAGQLERELSIWQSLYPLFKASRRFVIPGNHDFRIVRWSWSQPALFNFKPLSLQSLIQLPIIEAGYVRVAEGCFTLTHGAVIRKWSGQSAKAEMERWGTGGASAHTHRAGVYFARDSCGVRAWAESGHLQRNPPRYAPIHEPGPLNWQQAVGTLEIEGNSYHVEVHPFTLNYRAVLSDRKYKA